jgi:hypothetical protein
MWAGTIRTPAHIPRKPSTMLPPWVSYCCIDELVVFLDVRRNRYEAIPRRSGQAILTGQWQGLTPRTQEQVRARGWLTQPNTESSTPEVMKASREYSARAPDTATGRRYLDKAIGALLQAKLMLKFRSLEHVLNRCVMLSHNTPSTTLAPLCELIAAFDILDRLLLGANSCLLRSVALHRLLASMGHRSAIVFGVRLHPFEAHCWLQQDDLVLNDTIEQIGLFRALRLVQ